MALDVNSYKQKVESRLKVANDKIQEMKERASQEYNESLSNFEQRREKLEIDIEEAKEDTFDAWEVTKENIEEELRWLEREVADTWSRYKSET